MPIKLPKGFQRRKSSGNALEELPNPPEPSFRVFERPQGRKSFDGGNTYNNYKRMSLARPLSEGQFGEDHPVVDGRARKSPLNRGSGGTHNSASSAGQNDNSSSEARFSSTSTLPSSADIPLDDGPSPNAKNASNLPAPPLPMSNPLSFRAAGRAFSFGRKRVESPTVDVPGPGPLLSTDNARSEGYESFSRPRAMTESSYTSGSTATPPKLLGAGLDLDQSSLSEFGTMFESFGKSEIKLVEEPEVLGGTDTESPENVSSARSVNSTKHQQPEPSSYTASPLNGEPYPEVEGSRRIWNRDSSHGGLMANSSQRAAEALSFYSGKSSESRPDQNLPKSRTVPQSVSNSPLQKKMEQRPLSGAGEGFQRNRIHATRKASARGSVDSDVLQGEDVRLAMDSLAASQKLNRQSGNTTAYKDSDDEADNPAASLMPQSSYPSPNAASGPRQSSGRSKQQLPPNQMFNSSDQDFSATPSWQDSTETTPRAQKRELMYQEERSLFDASPQPTERSAPPSASQVRFAQKPETQNKIMTPAQFEQYRKEQETRREQYFNQDLSDEEGDDYEDDDVIERNKQLARQRRKQEAHLSVYRQQMMKVTGEQPSDLPGVQLRPSMDRSNMSAPNLTNRSSTPTFSFDKPSDLTKTSDDEDEDVPLGVLAAHGFPSKNRPPTALTNSGASIHYKSESYPPPPLSTTGTTAAGSARGLPPFARNLPPDPYYGAGLVNPSNRESLALGHGAPASVHSSHPPSMAPGGLVGVIAGEERARAARRGSPNAQGNYNSLLPPGMSQMQMGLLPGMPPMMSPGEQATVQMSEQMSQMMQMQMQWMQQMQHMMSSGMQNGSQMPSAFAPYQQQMMMSAGIAAPPGNSQRPVPSNPRSAPGSPAATQEKQQRAMSMMGPASAAGWHPQNTNRNSVVPSMMSGALGGPDPGYAASIAPSERSNVGMPSRYRPVSTMPADEHAQRAPSRTSTFTSGMLQPGMSNWNITPPTLGDRQSKPSLRPIAQTSHRRSTASDDDDEEGWEEMKKRREKKKSMWRMNKTNGNDGDLNLYEDYQAASF